MKLIKNIVLTTVALTSFAFAKAQTAEDCTIMLQIYAENAKARNYEEAFKQLDPLVKTCPTISAAVYQYGERIYNHRIENKIGVESDNVKGLLAMLNGQITNFPDKVDVTRKSMEIARTMYQYKMGDNATQYKMFDDLFKKDRENFTDPNGIITYFTLAKGEFDAGNMDLKGLFEIYDALQDKISNELDERSVIVDKLGDKESEGTITDDEKQTLENQKINLSNYDIVAGSLTGTIGTLVDCDYLVPLYTEQFEANKTDEAWLISVLNRLSAKDCTDAPIYLKDVKALHEIRPSARTAYGLGVIAKSEAEKFKYWDQAIQLGVSNDIVSKIHYAKGNSYKSKGQYSQAKAEYLAANRARPSFGAPYLRIAQMMAASVNSCGGATPLEKRAVYWVAARYADKAASIDGSIRGTANATAASYRASAPSKQEIFSSKELNSGSSIRIGCWIGESVTIP